MKNKIIEAVQKLQAESLRYTELAKDAALRTALLARANNEPLDRRGYEETRLAQDHVLRAETYKAAAAIINPES